MTVAWIWLYGPPGVGKSATGFELFEQLVRRNKSVAFIELDQIGMCMPAPVPSRSTAKAINLLGILDNFGAAGASGVIVCGDLASTMREVVMVARSQPVLCRLRADDDVAFRRLTIRRSAQYATSSGAYEAYNVPAGDLDISTHPQPVTEVAAEIVRRLGDWPGDSMEPEVCPSRSPTVIDDAAAILVTGPRVVGTSMAAWQALMASIAADHRTGYLDLEQLGFLPEVLQGASLPTKLANVATCWAGFRDQGAARLVLCGHVDDHELGEVRALIPSIRVVALNAAPGTLLERARRRSQQKDIWLPGDDLFGRDDDYLREVVGRAAAFESNHADLVIETDGLTPAGVADRITPLWPGGTTL